MDWFLVHLTTIIIISEASEDLVVVKNIAFQGHSLKVNVTAYFLG